MVDKIVTDKYFTAEFSVSSLILRGRSQQTADSGCRGFTLVELIVVCAILGVLATIALPAFNEYTKSARKARCAADLRTIDKAIAAYVIERNVLPTSLSAVGMGNILDPWQRPFEFHNLDIVVNPGATPLEDVATNPLNTDYDLYSKGADGGGTPASGDPGNDDDIARSNDGIFVGVRP